MADKLSPKLSWSLGETPSTPVPGLLFDLLRAVEQHGSLAAAAKQCRVSYRNAWNLMKLWRDQLGAPLIELCQGRGATLTALGGKLVWLDGYANQEVSVLLESVAQRAEMELDAVMQGDHPRPVEIHASHCLSHQPLTDLLRREKNLKVTFRHGGSGRCLQHLGAGDCAIAGFHLAEGPLRSGFVQLFKRYFIPSECRFITALHRRQGLIVKRGNPLGIRGIQDLVGTGVRFVNRQADSGTRVLLDMLLQSEAVDASDIHGYDNIEFTHSAVSALVAGSSADTGIGLEAAAVAQDLDFIPLASEAYYYAVRRVDWSHPQIQAIRGILESASWRRLIAEMDGFDAADAGEVVAAEHLFSD